MGAKLEDCPAEIIDNIVRLLDLKDICNLRIAGRRICTKASQGCFISYFHSKEVDITEKDLREFAYLTRPGRLGHHIQNLTLVGVVWNTIFLKHTVHYGRGLPRIASFLMHEGARHGYDPSDRLNLEKLEQRRAENDQFIAFKTDAKLLSEAFRNIQTNNLDPKLRSVTLKVAVYRDKWDRRQTTYGGGSFKLIWQSAADTFHTIMESLAATGLSVERLNIFNGRQMLQSCSLASDELGKIDVTSTGLAKSLASLRLLSVSFSERMIYSSPHDAEFSFDGGVYGQRPKDGLRKIEDKFIPADHNGNFDGLSKLLQLCHNLEELELHEFFLSQTGIPRHDERAGERMLQHVSAMQRPLHRLKRLELRGLHLREKVLLDFLTSISMHDLSLYNIQLTTGDFKEIFRYCTSSSAMIERLHLQELQEQYIDVDFDEGVTDEPLPFSTSCRGCKLNRTGVEVRKPIRYTRYMITVSARDAFIYSQHQTAEYGPVMREPPERNHHVAFLRREGLM